MLLLLFPGGLGLRSKPREVSMNLNSMAELKREKRLMMMTTKKVGKIIKTLERQSKINEIFIEIWKGLGWSGGLQGGRWEEEGGG